ncbi:SOS response-associated peptidase [Cohnella abietis]|uniref:Abasic site processing protein n=1 Tax=Cohnella abietis TaxID=2507935 RepID=A0A3T1D4L2_9BACL|nr:SOS response-associated peptidase [Cohnella abietis]BBI32978.1 putative SOS response-associated peptidase YoqW [Cohnella abietis]
MCNRFSLTADLSDLTEDFRIDKVQTPYSRRYNISPTQQIPIVQQIGGERCLSEQRWGLMPYWGKNSINANLDTLSDRTYLRNMLTKKRCIIPCSGFYVMKQEGKSKSAWRVVHKNKSTFAMPGIYDVWLDSEKNEFPMCTVITQDSSFYRDYSLPVILDEEAIETWLNPSETRSEVLHTLLRALPDADLRSYSVSPFIENRMLETPDCIEEIHPSLSLIKI